MRWLPPKRRRPGERTILHHPLVTTPRGIDQDVEPVTGIFDLAKRGRRILVARMITTDSLDRGRQVRGVDTSAGGEDLESVRGQFRGDASADSPGSSCNACRGPQNIIGEQKGNIKAIYRTRIALAIDMLRDCPIRPPVRLRSSIGLMEGVR